MSTVERQPKLANLKRLEHGVKAVFMTFFRYLLKDGRKNLNPLDGHSMKKVLFLRPESKLGDMIISLPIIDAFKRHFPDTKIAILCSHRNVPIIKNDPRFDQIFLYRKSLWRDLRMLKQIRAERFDAVLDLLCDDSVTSLFFSQFSTESSPRVGVGKRKFERYYDYNRYHTVEQSRHIIINTLHLLDAFEIRGDEEPGHAPVYLSAEAGERAESFVKSLGETPGLLVGVNVSAGSASRNWSRDKLVSLLGRIHNWDKSIRFMLISTPAEREQAIELRERINKFVPSVIPDRLSITEVAAIIKRLDLLVTPDTSLVHIARSFLVPVLSYYPGHHKNIRLWRPFGQETGFAMAKSPENVFDITVDQMYNAFCELTESEKLVRC